MYEPLVKLCANAKSQLSELPRQTGQNLIGLWYLGRSVITYAKGDNNKDNYWETSRIYIRSGEIAGIFGAGLTTFIATYLAQATISTIRRWGIIKTTAVLSLVASLPVYALYATYKNQSNPFHSFVVLIVKMASKYLRSVQISVQDTFDYWRYRWNCRSTFDRSLEKSLWTMIQCLKPDDKISFSLKYRTINKVASNNQASEQIVLFAKLDRNLFGIFQTIQKKMKENQYDFNESAEIGELCTIFNKDQLIIMASLDKLPDAVAEHQKQELNQEQLLFNFDLENLMPDKGALKKLLEESIEFFNSLTEEDIQKAPSFLQPQLRMMVANKETYQQVTKEILQSSTSDKKNISDERKAASNILEEEEQLEHILDSGLIDFENKVENHHSSSALSNHDLDAILEETTCNINSRGNGSASSSANDPNQNEEDALIEQELEKRMNAILLQIKEDYENTKKKN